MSKITQVNLGDATSSSFLVQGEDINVLTLIQNARRSGNFVALQLKGGEWIWVNPDQVTYVQVGSTV